MRTLIVGGGAVGGYLGAEWFDAGRDVLLLARSATAARLREHGVRVRTVDGQISGTDVPVATREDLRGRFDIVVVAVRSAAVDGAMEDVAPAIGDATTIVPLANGITPLESLTARYGTGRVVGGVAKLVTSLDGGVIVETARGASLQIGALAGATDRTDRLAAVAEELTGGGVTTVVADHIEDEMWSKFAFIGATATLTCLARAPIGDIAGSARGQAMASAVLDEVGDIARAEGHALSVETLHGLRNTLWDGQSRFGPSMYRDLTAGRPVEVDVLIELAERARRRAVAAPLVNAAVVALELHNRFGVD